MFLKETKHVDRRFIIHNIVYRLSFDNVVLYMLLIELRRSYPIEDHLIVDRFYLLEEKKRILNDSIISIRSRHVLLDIVITVA